MPFRIYLHVDKRPSVAPSAFGRAGPQEYWPEERKEFNPLVTTLSALIYVSRVSRQVAYDTLSHTV